MVQYSGSPQADHPGTNWISRSTHFGFGHRERAGAVTNLTVNKSLDRFTASAFHSIDLREFILPYDEVRNAKSPEDFLLDYLQTTYEAAANLAKWDRASLGGLKYL